MLAADRGLAASSSGRSWPEGVATVLRGNFHRAPCLPTRALCRHASARATTGSLSAATAVPDCPLLPAQRPASSAVDAFPSSCAVTSGALLAASGGGPQPSAGGGGGTGGRPGTVQAERRPAAAPQRPGGATGSGGGGGGGPSGEDDSASDSFQIGLDPFSQQLGLSALTGGAAAAIAAAIHLDLLACLRPDPGALALAAQLAAPVLALLGGVLAPNWAPPFKGTELQRLQHNYYMTAQVLQLYLEDDEEEEGEGAEAEGGGSLASGERARVRRRLRLDQAVGWGTISSGLALMQAYTLQPWNQPTGNSVFALALLGRSAQQLANEFLVRGAGWGLLSGWLFAELSSADASDGILFFGKVFGGPDAIKYAAGLGLVALSVPGALWEARSARNFVRASVVGPVRDAAIFCTGNGVDEPAYCDPKGFAMMAARRPQNAAPVADVVTKTRAWRSGPQSSFSSVSSVGSMDAVDATDLNAESRAATPPPTAAASAAAASAAAAPASDANSAAAGDAAGSNGAAATASSNGAAKAAASSNGSSGSSNGSGSGAVSGSGGGGGGGPMPAVGPTVAASSMAFEWDSEDMGVLLRVETFQDTIAFWSALYYQLLAAFAINGAFLASDCNLLASFGAAWLLRTGPLLLAEARARLTAARAAA
ncbi:hypothetical protein HYH03_012896 [Edaphochlamys debaryana]|uniref:Uncharacterized protein n=1 Tax=Edaphochlamys debaryana TaxID=47281 RepID=A0A836BTZ3_9CHLO|nr:hypothetical protein HYH03_012896 [Edaphochlamys debaryana]|eukprot:KAG2488577.1 hypothetical protein HYH03_012896 [Edaphochlamys debaryana]